jgi:TPR repeat protein
MTLQPGATLGPFRVVEPLGRGGMASVVKAYEAALDRYVALKVLPAEFMHEPAFAERFKREAKVIASLEHPNIVPIYAFGIDDGIPWMAMRLIAGGTASSLLQRRRLEPLEAIRILQGVASALDHAHSRGIVHRDVKPQNVLLDEAGQVYLADFGIAKIVEGSTVMTRTGMVTGTPEYMAPEQAQAQTIDHRADIYSLGILAYQMLTGRLPYQADTPVAVVMKHILEPLPLPAAGEVPEPVARALMKCLDKKPEARWPSASAFVAALAKGMEDSGARVAVREGPQAGSVQPAPVTQPTLTRVKGTTATVRGLTGPTAGLDRATVPERDVPRAGGAGSNLAVGLGVLVIGLVVVCAVLVARLGTQARQPPAAPETTASRPEALEPTSQGPHEARAMPLSAPPVLAASPPPAERPRSELQATNDRGVPKDKARAATLLKQACDGGEMQGCHGLGWMYVRGTGVPKDGVRAAALFKQACDGGAMLGCNGLAWTYERGIGVSKDEARAAALYKQACDGGAMQACSGLGWMYVRGTGVSKDEARAAALYKQACDGGAMLGCNGLAWMYVRGNSVQKDDGHALTLFKRACDGGEMQGCSGLGWLYVRGGPSVSKDEARALALFEQACEGGAMPGCHGLGWMYERGTGVPKNEARAAALYKQACDGGAMPGCSSLGGMYDRGSGVPKDAARALALFKQACSGGEPRACDNLKR